MEGTRSVDPEEQKGICVVRVRTALIRRGSMYLCSE